jgi:hypothetical protein
MQPERRRTIARLSFFSVKVLAMAGCIICGVVTGLLSLPVPSAHAQSILSGCDVTYVRPVILDNFPGEGMAICDFVDWRPACLGLATGISCAALGLGFLLKKTRVRGKRVQWAWALIFLAPCLGYFVSGMPDSIRRMVAAERKRLCQSYVNSVISAAVAGSDLAVINQLRLAILKVQELKYVSVTGNVSTDAYVGYLRNRLKSEIYRLCDKGGYAAAKRLSKGLAMTDAQDPKTIAQYQEQVAEIEFEQNHRIR